MPFKSPAPYLQFYKNGSYTKLDTLNNNPEIRKKAYNALGYTSEAFFDSDEEIRYEAFETIGYTRSALLDESSLVSFGAHEYFKLISFLLGKKQIQYTVSEKEAYFLREYCNIPVFNDIIYDICGFIKAKHKDEEW